MDSVLLDAIFEGIDPKEWIELRVIEEKERGAEGRSLFFDNTSDLLKVAGANNGQLHCYFGVAPRTEQRGTKAAVGRSLVIWAEVDAKDAGDKVTAFQNIESFVLPASFIVDSGHGFHAYWLLREAISVSETELLLKAVAKEIPNSDKAVSEIARVMRVPGTLNIKHAEDIVECKIAVSRPQLRYFASDVKAATRIGPDTKLAILDDSHVPAAAKDQSRSGRDWIVIRALKAQGMSADAIRDVFRYAVSDIGAKIREEENTQYLSRTIDRASQQLTGEELVATYYSENDNCYIADGTHVVSTFVFEPHRLLVDETGEDAFVGDIRAGIEIWPAVVLTKGAFSGVATLLKQLKDMRWQWLGGDKEVRMLLPYLVSKWREKGMPKVKATEIIGRHIGHFVHGGETISATAIQSVYEAPIVYKPTGRVHPELSFHHGEDFPVLLEIIHDLLPQINLPEVIWPIIGWFMATPLKPVFNSFTNPVRFPHLNLFGTKGSGKSSLVLKVFLRMAGYNRPSAHSCSTTTFVLLSLMSSTNCIPVSLAEYRRSSMNTREFESLKRCLLLSYDSSSNSRGRSDQTTQEYEMVAPVVLDGEDMISDPAIQERIVLAKLTPSTIAESTQCWETFDELVDLPLEAFALPYLQYTLAISERELEARWKEAFHELDAVFPTDLGDRVRRNLATTLTGIRLYESFLGKYGIEVEPVHPSVLGDAKISIQTTALGRGTLAVDSFIEECVNEVALVPSKPNFLFDYDHDANILWLHLSSAHKWWVQESVRRQVGFLEKAACKQQLKECSISPPGPGCYIHGPKSRHVPGSRTLHMYGVDLALAHANGLDVPESLHFNRIMVRIPTKENST